MTVLRASMAARPAFFSTPEPPVTVADVELQEYIKSLRRRIEVQSDQAAALAEQLTAAREEIEKLSLDLGIADQCGRPSV